MVLKRLRLFFKNLHDRIFLFFKNKCHLSLTGNPSTPQRNMCCSLVDRGAPGVDGLQRHQLSVPGEPPLRSGLLCRRFLRPLSSDGLGLPAHLRHRHDTRTADCDVTSCRIRCHPHNDDPGHLGKHGIETVPPQDDDHDHDLLVTFGTPASHGHEQPNARGDEGGEDPCSYYGVFLPVLGAVLYHEYCRPVHPLLCALAAVDGLAVVGVHQLGPQPVSLRLPEPGLPPGLPGHPLLRGPEVCPSWELPARTHQAVFGRICQRDVYGTEVRSGRC